MVSFTFLSLYPQSPFFKRLGGLKNRSGCYGEEKSKKKLIYMHIALLNGDLPTMETFSSLGVPL
jgi:hypothetical protein